MKKKSLSNYRINGRFEFIQGRLLLKDLVNKQEVKLEPLIAETLSFLIENRGEVITRDELISMFWQTDTFSDEALTKAISKLRKELHDDTRDPKYIRTISKVGYEWIGEVEVKETYMNEVIRKIPVLEFNRRTITGLVLILVILFVIKSIFLPHH